MSNNELAKALYEWRARKDRRHHPSGKFDKQGRFYPDGNETCECCKGIRSPSVAYPYSLMTHCRSVEHVANMFKVDVAELRRETRYCKHD